VRAGLFALLFLTGLSSARAEQTVLRLAAIAPEGTAWAREVKAFARDVETATGGQVRVKWYLGGIAGDELASIDRIRRGQLDGAALAVSCSELAPSLRVTRIIGLFRNRGEARFVFSRLFSLVAEELHKAGFTGLGISAFGSDIIFSQTPVRSLDDLRRQRPWIWNLDKVWREEWPLLGVHAVALPVESASSALDHGTIDGFLALPTAALAYQWSTQVKYYTPFVVGYLPACLVMSDRTFDALSTAAQKEVRTAAAKLTVRFDDVNEDLERQLLGGLFQKQGLSSVPISPTFRAELFAEARRARDQLPDSVVPHALLEKVNAWLADFRAEHP
jgi:TRAP-type C4-dicarboxylate transport system substrate-binding protein